MNGPADLPHRTRPVRRLSIFCLAFLCLAAGCRRRAAEAPPDASAGAAESSHGTVRVDAPREPTRPDPPLKFVPPDLTAQEIESGWVSLFDGVSLFGWDVPSDGNWRVEGACIVADDGPVSLLTFPFCFGDFELRCDVHLEPGGNSGIFLRSAANPRDPKTDTWEMNICDSHASFPTGSIVGRHRAAGVPAVEGAWHTFRIRCHENRVQVWLDDAPITDFTDDSPFVRRRGTIGLQKNSGRAAFRNIFVRPIDWTNLFNGRSLDGWTAVDGSESRFEVHDGLLQVRGGPGFLQTDSVHQDFLLLVQVRTNGQGLNSGVFFRAQPGTIDAPSNGYEMQIHNGFEEGDRTRPTDSGTGAIFRRAPARYVVGRDQQWMTAVLAAQGPRFATWVNGYPVVSWTDTRDPHDNPRRGRRLAAGHISLQGHDPATDLDFRAIRIHTLPASTE